MCRSCFTIVNLNLRLAQAIWTQDKPLSRGSIWDQPLSLTQQSHGTDPTLNTHTQLNADCSTSALTQAMPWRNAWPLQPITMTGLWLAEWCVPHNQTLSLGSGWNYTPSRPWKTWPAKYPLSVCVCVWVCVREREREKMKERENKRIITWSCAWVH